MNYKVKNLIEQGLVEKTDEQRYATFNNLKKMYSIYKVDIKYLFFNEQNDRISSSMYEHLSKEKIDNFSENKTFEEYNILIEKMIAKNDSFLKNTIDDISKKGQQVPGAILKNGRVIDGNRRFASLRAISRRTNETQYFLTIILPADIKDDAKQIKALEWEIQIGRQGKVPYKPINAIIGVYKQICIFKKFSIEEYVKISGKKSSEVNDMIVKAKLIEEYLLFINAKNEYSIAEKINLDPPFREFLSINKKIGDKERINDLKNIMFSNIFLDLYKDVAKRFVREIMATIIKKNNQKLLDEFIKVNKPSVNDVIDEIGKYEWMNEDVRLKQIIPSLEPIRQKIKESNKDFLEKVGIKIDKDSQVKIVIDIKRRVLKINREILSTLREKEKQNFHSEIQEVIKLLKKFTKDE